ncbi:putative membrane protein YeiH [Cryobacterium psychrophilum]|uniref:Trimeric intracellular cation channel family protein n=2 Tax=Cryobacterium psychrophilum TaxID=41988 RepID=A0A4Y8KNE1_9MICO|nr:putative membrane protein YeiH [Cryobacterium psychrophilum]TFD78641.1 trimeric intracellular cation channel family protein [Cryobacterium psychrophilum]
MTMDSEAIFEVIRFVDLAGVLANAILGGVAARSARLDIVGFVVLAIMSGLGGGIIRDTLLQQGPPAALTDSAYLITAVLGGVIAYFVTFNGRWSRRVLVLLDALAVGCWSAVGAQKALDAGLGWMPAILLGITTAVGGGMVRDVMLLKVPTIFGGNTLYATSAVLASTEMVIMSKLGFVALGTAVAILSGAVLSLLARRYGWVLPTGYALRIPKPIFLINPRAWRERRRSAKRRSDLE